MEPHARHRKNKIQKYTGTKKAIIAEAAEYEQYSSDSQRCRRERSKVEKEICCQYYLYSLEQKAPDFAGMRWLNSLNDGVNGIPDYVHAGHIACRSWMNIAGVGARIADNDNLVPENSVLHLVQPMDLLEKVPSRVALKGVWGYEEKAYPIAVEIVPVGRKLYFSCIF